MNSLKSLFGPTIVAVGEALNKIGGLFQEKPKKYKIKIRPILNLLVEIPFLSIRTSILNERIDWRAVEYIRLDIHLWKWSFDFRFYNTYERLEEKRGGIQ